MHITNWILVLIRFYVNVFKEVKSDVVTQNTVLPVSNNTLKSKTLENRNRYKNKINE